LRASELAMILDGIDVSKLKRVPRYERTVRRGEEKSSNEKISKENIITGN
jgi:transposase